MSYRSVFVIRPASEHLLQLYTVDVILTQSGFNSAIDKFNKPWVLKRLSCMRSTAIN